LKNFRNYSDWTTIKEMYETIMNLCQFPRSILTILK